MMRMRRIDADLFSLIRDDPHHPRSIDTSFACERRSGTDSAPHRVWSKEFLSK
jgi:hypothetical protein